MSSQPSPQSSKWREVSVPLLVLRIVFVMLAVGLAATIISAPWFPAIPPLWLSWAVFAGCVGLALAVIAVDVLFRQKQLEVISSVYFGTIVGLFLAYVVGLA